MFLLRNITERCKSSSISCLGSACRRQTELGRREKGTIRATHTSGDRVSLPAATVPNGSARGPARPTPSPPHPRHLHLPASPHCSCRCYYRPIPACLASVSQRVVRGTPVGCAVISVPGALINVEWLYGISGVTMFVFVTIHLTHRREYVYNTHWTLVTLLFRVIIIVTM